MNANVSLDHPALIWKPSQCGKMIDHNDVEHCALTKPVPTFVRKALAPGDERMQEAQTDQHQKDAEGDF
ncbi:MAG: hypothetical protein ACRCUE_11605, partial [Bosea sp. (in: a-proteobacteria)]